MAAVGTLLSEFRKRNRLSQLDLSLLADVSCRHISFIETGRSQPSRGMLLRLAEVLNLPHKDSNLLLHCAGFAAAYSDLDLESDELTNIRAALEMMLDNHQPYPALVMDGNYNLLMANDSQQRLMAKTNNPVTQQPLNMLEASFRDDLFKPLIANWEEVASHLLRRLRRQLLAYDTEAHKLLFNKLLELGAPEDWQTPGDNTDDGPVLTIDIKLPELELSMFTTVSQFGTALDIGMEEILIESYFPANDATRAFFHSALN
jgi:transcriptional regulator with XRE-family HTH domain